MFSFSRKNQKLSAAVLLAVFVFIVLAGSLAPVHKAGAVKLPGINWLFGKVEEGFSGAMIAIINLILSVYFFIIGTIITIELKILAWVMSSFSWNNATVILGWGIVRDVANLFFIVVIMIIAFATVLQLETYGMKALLPKLIAVALLINFSLAICGFLINFADAFGKTFIQAGGGAAQVYRLRSERDWEQATLPRTG